MAERLWRANQMRQCNQNDSSGNWPQLPPRCDQVDTCRRGSNAPHPPQLPHLQVACGHPWKLGWQSGCWCQRRGQKAAQPPDQPVGGRNRNTHEQ